MANLTTYKVTKDGKGRAIIENLTTKQIRIVKDKSNPLKQDDNLVKLLDDE